MEACPLKLFASAALGKAPASVRFPLRTIPGRFGPVQLEGFAIRGRDGSVRGYLNMCPHRGQPVDLGDGQLFTRGGRLECQAHGAYFEPDSGLCVAGACPGRSLTRLTLQERDGAVWLCEPAEVEP